jgi:hypothetical protein
MDTSRRTVFRFCDHLKRNELEIFSVKMFRKLLRIKGKWRILHRMDFVCKVFGFSYFRQLKMKVFVNFRNVY